MKPSKYELLDGIFTLANFFGGMALMVDGAYEQAVARAVVGCVMYVVGIFMVLR